MGEKRDRTIQELREQLAAKQESGAVVAEKKNRNFWGTSGFKIIASMSMLVLAAFSRR